MKKYFLILAAALFAFTACQENEPEVDDKTPEDVTPGKDDPSTGGNDEPNTPTVSFELLSEAVVNIGAESEISVVKFTAPEAWSAEVVYPESDTEEYVVLGSASGEAGEVELKVTVQSLPEELDGRYFNLLIASGEASADVRFFQGNVFVLSNTWFEFGTDGGTASFSVLTNLEYTVTTYDVFDWAPLTFDEATGEGSIQVGASKEYDNRVAYVKFTIPALQDLVIDDETGEPTGETKDHVERVYVSQEGNLKVAWVQDFNWAMYSPGRESIVVMGDYIIINAPISEYETGGLNVFSASDGSYLGAITLPESLTGITMDDAGNVVLTSGGDYPIDEENWCLIEDEQIPLRVYVLTPADIKVALDNAEIPEITPLIEWNNEFYGYGVDNVRVTGDVTGKAVIDVVSAAYQEEEWTNRVVSWQVIGGETTQAPTASKLVPADMSIWTPADLVAMHVTPDVDGGLYYMGYDGNYQLWYAPSMEADWQDVLDSGSTWVEGYGSMDIIEWNGHKYLGFVAETYFAWYGWGSLPSYLWIVNIDNPYAPEVLAKTACDITGNPDTWQYGQTADLQMVVEGSDLAVYVVDAGISVYQKIVYPKM